MSDPIARNASWGEWKVISLKTPHPRQFTEFFRRLPGWVIPLIVILLFGRLILILIFHLLSE